MPTRRVGTRVDPGGGGLSCAQSSPPGEKKGTVKNREYAYTKCRIWVRTRVWLGQVSQILRKKSIVVDRLLG